MPALGPNFPLRPRDEPGIILCNTTNPRVLELKARRAQVATQAKLDKPKGKKAPQLLTAQVVALEGVVGAEHLPLYVRFYAWTKLLRHWTSMRWDDTNGIVPHCSRRRARPRLLRLKCKRMQVDAGLYI